MASVLDLGMLVPADYRIRTDKGLAYIKFWGHLTMVEVQTCAVSFGSDPANIALHKHLVDFSGVTSYDPNVVKILETQAKLAELFDGDPAQWMFVYFAPTAISRELSSFGVRAWTGVPNVVIRTTTSERDTMEVLGLSEQTIGAALGDVTQS